MSGDCLGNGPSCATLTFVKGKKEGGKNRFGHHLFSPSPVSSSSSVRLPAPFFLLLFSLSFEWVQRPIKERAAAAGRLGGWLLLFNESGPPLLDSPPPFPSSFTALQTFTEKLHFGLMMLSAGRGENGSIDRKARGRLFASFFCHLSVRINSERERYTYSSVWLLFTCQCEDSK